MAKPKKYATKKASGGAQQYTRSGVTMESALGYAKGKMSTKKAKMLGSAAATAFIDRGSKRSAVKVKATADAKKRKGKPMGGK